MEDGIHNKRETVVENKNQLAFPTRTLDPNISIVDQAKEIEKAEEFLRLKVSGKLDTILKQIKILQKEAEDIIRKSYDDIELHKIQCSFQKIPGEIIYLYERSADDFYFSRLSPADWNNNPPNKFICAYKLNYDRSFEKYELKI